MTCRLLLVERDLALAGGLAGVLAGRGYLVTIARGAPEAVTALAVAVPDIVLIDITDPDERADELARVLASDDRLRGVTVVALSSLVGVQRELPPRTAAVVIGAPFTIDPIAELIDGLCRRLEQVTGAARAS